VSSRRGSRLALRLLCQLPQPSLEVVEPALDVVQLGEELERLLPADGVAGAGGEYGDVPAELLDLEPPVECSLV
jgi:hypothetical protein